ncbi:uncharacterized protein MONOS_17718 [Monocercomonoides exilis]|uniref:uncharacterized protein n=1 Tax=Monocercomonoides exilis TaxID=2049356 RepID=UPI003559BAC8|nr:hypothetical protein MONOS_17718 [Monocercomonoides exilis]
MSNVSVLMSCPSMCLFYWLYSFCAAPSASLSPDATKKSACATNGTKPSDGEYVPRRSGTSVVEEKRGAERADERYEEEVVEMIADEVTAAGKFDEVVGAATTADCWRLSG